jgi:hypothetical protein
MGEILGFKLNAPWVGNTVIKSRDEPTNSHHVEVGENRFDDFSCGGIKQSGAQAGHI